MHNIFANESHGPDLVTFLPKKSESKINPFAVATMNLSSNETNLERDLNEECLKFTCLLFQFLFSLLCLPVNAENFVGSSVKQDESASNMKSDFCDCAEKMFRSPDEFTKHGPKKRGALSDF